MDKRKQQKQWMVTKKMMKAEGVRLEICLLDGPHRSGRLLRRVEAGLGLSARNCSNFLQLLSPTPAHKPALRDQQRRQLQHS